MVKWIGLLEIKESLGIRDRECLQSMREVLGSVSALHEQDMVWCIPTILAISSSTAGVHKALFLKFLSFTLKNANGTEMS